MKNQDCRKKVGVSLVTVLMFMLVATIAATATYKWITSEGHSSASRMMQREAYQSAVAGIESARSWMTYHANETGALIKQYKDGGSLPIRLTDPLAPFIRAGQSYDVWLVGVNTSAATYKLKIMSTGTARDGGASHTEIAILNVNGLYQVMFPQVIVSGKSPVEFNYAYFGGTSTGTQSKFSSILINGDWQGNQGEYPGSFIVTGKADLTGNGVKLGELNCIGGDLDLGNQGILRGGNLYVGGNVSPAKMTLDSVATDSGKVPANAYFDGDVDQAGSTQNEVHVHGSVTLNGTFKTYFPNQSYWVKIRNDLCLTDQGHILFRGSAQSNDGSVDKATFAVLGNVWMPGTYPMSTDPSNPGVDNYQYYDRILLGNSSESKLYMRAGHAWNDYNTLMSNKRWTENTSHPRKCGAEYTYAYNGVENTDVHVCDNGGSEFWSGEVNPSIYASKTSKTGLHYIYYMPEGRTDVEFGRYFDNYWKWCTQTGVDSRHGDFRTHCWTYDAGTWMNAYFINFSTKSDATAFTTSYHTQDANHTVNKNGNYYRYLNHDGTNVTGSPYCTLASGKNWRPACGVTPWFKSKGTVSNSMASQPFTCANHVKDLCDTIWDPSDNGCDNSKYFIDDPIEIPIATLKAFAASSKACPDVTKWEQSMIQKLNDCYATHNASTDETYRREKLYNGDYLVVEIGGNSNDASFSGKKLKGKFVIIVKDKISMRNSGSAISAEDDGQSFALLYLDKGTIYLPTNSDWMKHIFIYMNEPNSGESPHLHLKGTLYFPAGQCVKNDFRDAEFENDPELIESLGLAGVVCKKGKACATGSSTPATGEAGDGTVTVTFDKVDDYYISVAPQLSVSLESQYENKETAEGAGAVELRGSFVVLPRIVYLTKDAVGKLEDYYSVITLNSSTQAQVSNVVCKDIINPSQTIPAEGKLTASGQLEEGYYNCEVTATISGSQKTVPFMVVVKGEGAAAPKVYFAESNVELGIGHEENVRLGWEKTTGASFNCKVTISVSDHGDEWSVSPIGVSTADNDYVVTINTGNDPSDQDALFNVRNNSSSDGSVLFMIKKVEGCNPGTPSVEVIYNSNSMKVQRKDLAEYCAGPGNGTDGCKSNGEYRKWIDAPDCALSSSEIWVTANGDNCQPTSPNSEWSCGITGNVALEEANAFEGCRVIIPSENNVGIGPFAQEQVVPLYADIKAVQQTFHTGFSGTPGDASRQINISVTGPGDYSASSSCKPSDFDDDTKRSEKCDVPVYRGSRVELSLSETSQTEDFNYWKCESGSTDCTDEVTSTVQPYVITITGENTVYAHFGETDKHCFFDEFKDEGDNNSHRDRAIDDVFCDGVGDGNYCIDICGTGDDHCVSASAGGNSKWKLVYGKASDIEYSDGRISLKSSLTRGKQESAKTDVKAIVMSSAIAGKKGDLKAQFQVPREAANMTTTVKNSGFILRSTPNPAGSGNSFLMLNVYATSTGALKARLCLNGGSTCSEKSFERDVSPTDIIMMSAMVGTPSDANKLVVEVWPSSWSNNSSMVTFDIDDLSGAEVTATNEYVGYSLADPNFKIYGIGWYSSTYGSSCWDTYPTVSCSFKAAYVGGIVPKDEKVKPWTGLSAWYSYNNCDISMDYYYLGNDACGKNASSYTSCGSEGYEFSGAEADGAHGYIGTDGNEKRTAKVFVANGSCQVYGDESVAWATQGVASHCGEFWVGKLNPCSSNIKFSASYSGAEGTYYGLASGTANLREADLVVTLDNPNGSEIEVYLFSQNGADRYYSSDYIYSQPYKTTQQGSSITLTIPVASLSTVEGFDPENVVGVYVKSFGDYSVNVSSVQSSCPNVISIEKCTAAFNPSSGIYPKGKWEINTVVNNYTHTKNITVSENHSNISATAPACDYPSAGSNPLCSFGNINGKKATNLLQWEDNPFASSNTYGFTVSVTPDEGSLLTKDCEVTQVTGITAQCGNLSTSAVAPGGGLPVFSYSINNCPDNKCSYKITLNSGETVVSSTTIDDCAGDECNHYNRSTSPDVANKDTPLDERENYYYFTLESTNSDRAFASCNSGKFSVRSSSVTASCSVTGNLYQGQQLTLNVSSISGEVDKVSNSGSDMTWTLTDGGSNTVTRTIKCNRSSCWDNTVTAPAAGDYTYTLTFEGGKVCSGNVTIADVNDEVGATCSNVSSYPGATVQNFITMSNLGNITSNTPRVIKINDNQVGSSNNCNKNYCEPMQMTAPNTTGEYTYYMYFNNLEKCHGTLTVNPKLTCSATKKSLTLGETFDFTANYGGDCWGATFSGSGAPNSGCNMNYSSIQPTMTGQQIYTISVTSGSIGNATCSDTVEVGEATPTAKCPTGTINAEPGTTIPFTPTVTGCGSGCNYRVDWVGHSGDPKKSVTNYSYTSGQISFTGDATGGNNTYRFTVMNKKTTDNTADCEITVNYQKPTYNCPTDKEVAVGATVAVTPTSVTNCTQGCGYKVTKNSSTGTEVIGPGTGYTSGALGSGFTGESNAGTVTYYVTLSNPAGDGTACDFDVTYKEAASLCNCTCSSGCDNLNTSGGTSASTGVCYFATAFDIGAWNSTNVNVNGHTFSGSQKTQSNYDPIDGGYYIQFTSYYYPSVSMTGGTPVCGGGGGGASSSSAAPSSSSASGSFACNAGNSTSISSSPFNISGSTCYKYYSGGSKWQVGNWSGSAVSVTYKKCNGTVSTVSAANNGWTAVDIGGTCDVYATFGTSASLQFGSW